MTSTESFAPLRLCGVSLMPLVRKSPRRRKVNSNRGLVDLSLQTMDGAPHSLELRVIMRAQHFVTLFLQLPDARFDRGLVDSHNVMMLMLDAQCIGEGHQQMLLVHLGKAL